MQDKRWLASLRPVTRGAQRFWIVVVAPRDDFIPWTQRDLGVALLLVLAALAVGWTAALWLARRITRPLEQLAAQSERIGAMDLAHPVDVRSPLHEINQLVALLEGMRVNLLDATNRLQEFNATLEDRVRRRTLSLQQANANLEDFAYSASHDLRAPLIGLKGYAALLVKKHGKAIGEEGLKYLDRISVAARRMEDIISDLLRLASTVRLEMQRRPVNLSALTHTIAMEMTAAQPQRGLQWRIDDGLWAVADNGMMRIVLENLFGNACKYTVNWEDAVIEFTAAPMQGGMREFFLRDNGAGFNMAYVDSLFKPFKRLHTDKEFSGNGIGLATVKRIVERHGGSVRAQGEVDHGATIYFTRPV